MTRVDVVDHFFMREIGVLVLHDPAEPLALAFSDTYVDVGDWR